MRYTFLKVITLSALILSFGFAQAATPPFIPKHGKLLIIGQQQDSIDGYLKSINVVPGGFMFYTSIQKVDGLFRAANHGAGTMNAQMYIHRYPNTVIQLGLYMVGALDDVLLGKYDQNIITLANWMKSINRPVFLRIGYEFDLPENKYDPPTYQLVYRYIVDHIRAQGVNNVAYVWHSACLTESQGNYMDWYPGDNFVDWFAVSIFNPLQIETAKNFLYLARAHKKPYMIAESTPAGAVSTEVKKEWFKHVFDFIDAENIKVVCYINSDWDTYPQFHSMKWGDAQVQDDTEIEDLWIKLTHKGYLQSSTDLFDELSGEYKLHPDD